jgi:hypothetical protein
MLPDEKKVQAEFAQLQGKSVLVLIWAEPETVYEFPHIRYELATHIGDHIRAEVKGVKLTKERKVEDFVQEHFDAATDPVMVGEHFDVDMVVYVELLQFQIRDPDSPSFLQGQAAATVSVYNLRSEPDQRPFYELQEVAVTEPDQPMMFTSTGHMQVRYATYKAFSESVAKKFYDHAEKL